MKYGRRTLVLAAIVLTTSAFSVATAQFGSPERLAGCPVDANGNPVKTGPLASPRFQRVPVGTIRGNLECMRTGTWEHKRVGGPAPPSKGPKNGIGLPDRADPEWIVGPEDPDEKWAPVQPIWPGRELMESPSGDGW